MTTSFWLILSAVLAYELLHSLLASIKIKNHTHHFLGIKSDRWFRMAYNFFALVTLIPGLRLKRSQH